MRMFSPDEQQRLRLAVVWRGDRHHTEVLIMHPDKAVETLCTLTPEEHPQEFVQALRQQFPRLHIDVSPGAYGVGTNKEGRHHT